MHLPPELSLSIRVTSLTVSWGWSCGDSPLGKLERLGRDAQQQSEKLGWCGSTVSHSELARPRQEDTEFKDTQVEMKMF